MKRQSQVFAGERFRLPSGSVVVVRAVENGQTACTYLEGGKGPVAFAVSWLVAHATRLAQGAPA
jgi:hypothetical protein